MERDRRLALITVLVLLAEIVAPGLAPATAAAAPLHEADVRTVLPRWYTGKAPLSTRASRLRPAWFSPLVSQEASAADLLPTWYQPAGESPTGVAPAGSPESRDPAPPARASGKDIPLVRLTVDVYGPDVASLGSPIGAGEVYTAVIYNDSSDIAYNMYLTATHPSFFIHDGDDELVSSSGGTIPITTVTSSEAITWTPTTAYNLLPQRRLTLTFKLRAGCNAVSGQRLEVGIRYNADPPPATPDHVNYAGLNVTTGRGNLVLWKEPDLQYLNAEDFGEPITWTVFVQNTGLGRLYNAVVTDTGGEGLGQPAGDLTPSQTIPVLEPNEIATFTVVGTVEACNFTNVAYAAWPCGNQVGDATAQNPLSSTVSVLFTPDVPNVAVDVSSSVAFPYCEAVTRTVAVTLTNSGGPAGNFRLESTLDTDGFLEIVPGSVSDGWEYNDGVFSYTTGVPTGTLPPVEVGGPVTLSFQIRPQADYVCTGGSGSVAFTPHYQDVCTLNPFIGNVASLAYQWAQGGIPRPTLDLVKSGPGVVASGDVFTYQVSVSGDNPASIDGLVDVADTLPSAFVFTGSVAASSGTVTVADRDLAWTFVPTGAGSYAETLVYTVQVVFSDTICGASLILENEASASAQPVCAGCSALQASDEVRTAIENNEGIFPSHTQAGVYDVCGDGFVVANSYEITGSPVVTWTGAVFTEALGTPIGDGALPGPQYLTYRSGSLSVTVNGVDYTGFLTPVVTGGGQLQVDLGPLAWAVPTVPTQNLTLRITYTIDIPESVLTDTPEITFYDWSQLYLPNFSDVEGCAGNSAFNQVLLLTVGRGDLSVGLSPRVLDKCDTNQAVIQVTGGRPDRIADHVVVTFTSSTAEILSARNFTTTGALPDISAITVVSTPNTGGDRGIITFTFPAATSLDGDGSIRFDVDINCTQEAPWAAGITYETHCGVTRDDTATLNHEYRAPSLILFRSPIRYSLRKREAIWKFTVINNGNLAATDVLVTNTVAGFSVVDYQADGPGVSVLQGLPITNSAVTFLFDTVSPGQQRDITVTAQAIQCDPLGVTIEADLSCFGTTCDHPQEVITFDTPQPYLLTNNGETADLPMCDLGYVVFTTKNASPDVNLYRLHITETLIGLSPAVGEPITVTVVNPDDQVLASTTTFTPEVTTFPTQTLMVWKAISATAEVYTYFNELPPLHIIRIHVPVNTDCTPPASPRSSAGVQAEAPCGRKLGYTEAARTLQILQPDVHLIKDGRAATGGYGDLISVLPGELVVWRLRAYNYPSSRSHVAQNVVVSDVLPANFVFDSASVSSTQPITPHVVTATRTIWWEVGDMLPDDDPLTFYITGTVAVTDDACYPQTLNRADLRHGCDFNGCTSDDTPWDTARLRAYPNITVTLSPTPFHTCDNVVQVTVRNRGARGYTNSLTVDLSPGYVYSRLLSSELTPTQIITDPSSPVFEWDEIPGRTTAGNYAFDMFLLVDNVAVSGACPIELTPAVSLTMDYDDDAICTVSGPYQTSLRRSYSVLTPSLSLQKLPVYTATAPGQVVSWTIVLSNSGLGEGKNLVVTDTVHPDFVDFGATNGSWGEVPEIDRDGRVITWTLDQPLVTTLVPTLTQVVTTSELITITSREISTTGWVTTTVYTSTVTPPSPPAEVSETVNPVDDLDTGVWSDSDVVEHTDPLILPPVTTTTLSSDLWISTTSAVTVGNLVTTTVVETGTQVLTTTVVEVLSSLVSTRTEILWPQTIIPAVWTAEVTATAGNTGTQLINLVNAFGDCASGCIYASLVTTSYVTLLSEFDKAPEVQTDTIGDLSVFTFTGHIDGLNFLYENVILTDTLPEGLAYLSSTVTYVADVDGDDGGPTSTLLLTPTVVTAGDLGTTLVAWDLTAITPTLPGQISFDGVITTVVQDGASNYDGQRKTNQLVLSYNEVGQDFTFVFTETAGVDIVEPVLHIGKDYVTPYGCRAALFQDNFNAGDDDGWQAQGGSSWSVNEGLYRAYYDQGERTVSGTTWSDYSFSAMVRPFNGYGFGLDVRRDSGRYRFLWRNDQLGTAYLTATTVFTAANEGTGPGTGFVVTDVLPGPWEYYSATVSSETPPTVTITSEPAVGATGLLTWTLNELWGTDINPGGQPGVVTFTVGRRYAYSASVPAPELALLRDGQVLTSAARSYDLDRWMHTEIRAVGDQLEFFVDGALALSYTDASTLSLDAGGIGLYLAQYGEVEFDDVLVTRMDDVACTVGANDLVTYTLVISNQDRLPGYDLVVTDTVAHGLAFKSYTLTSDDPDLWVLPFPVEGETGDLVWGISQLTPTVPFSPVQHTAITLTVVLSVSDWITANVVLPNQAFLEYDGQPGAGPVGVERTYSGGSHSTAVRTVGDGILKTVGFGPPPTATLGSLITYTLIVPSRLLTATLYDVTVADTIHPSTTIEAVTTGGGTGESVEVSGQQVTATFASIPHDTYATVTITTRVSDDLGAYAGYVITNSGVVTYPTSPGITETEVVSTPLGEPELAVLKVSDPPTSSTVDANDPVTYTVLITHVSPPDPSPAYDVVLSDTVSIDMRDTPPAVISVTLDGAPVDPSLYVTGYVAATGVYTVVFEPSLAFSLPAGSVLQVVYRATVDADPPAVVDLFNHVQVTWSSLPGDTPGDRDYGPVEDQTVVHTPPPSIGKQQAFGSVPTNTVGSLVTYTLTVPPDDYEATIYTATVTDVVDSRLTIVAVTATQDLTSSVGWSGQTVTGTFDVIPVGAKGLITVTAYLNPSAANGDVITNDAVLDYGVALTTSNRVEFPVDEPVLHIGKTYVTPHGCRALLLGDDFNDGDAAGWMAPGGWAVANGAYSTPNDYSTSYRGDTGWTDYSLSAMVRAEDDSAELGLAFRRVGADTYRWRWSSSQMRLQRQIGASTTTLVTLNGAEDGYQAGRWYHVEVRVEGNHIRVYVDGQERIDYTDAAPNALLRGQIGLYNGAGGDVRLYDDVLVTRLDDMACPVGANDLVTYTLVISNQGRLPGYDLVVTDTLAHGLAFKSYILTGDDPDLTVLPFPVEGQTGDLVWGISQLTPTVPFSPVQHTAITLTVVLSVSDGITASVVLPNRAELAYDGQPGAGPVGVQKKYSGGSHSTAVRTVDGGIAKATTFSPPPTATLGSLVTYTLVVPATPITATLYDVQVSDPIHPDHGVVGVTTAGGTGPSYGVAGGVVTASFASIPHGTQATVTITARISASLGAVAGTVITNTGVMTHPTAPEITRTQEVSTPVGEPDLTILKASDPPTSNTVGANDRVTYTVTIDNWDDAGGSPAYDVAFTDTLPAEMRDGPFELITVTLDAVPVDAGLYVTGYNSTSGVITVTFDPTFAFSIPLGSELVIEYVATVEDDVSAGLDLQNDARVTWSSLPGAIPGDRDYGPVQSDATVHTVSPPVVKAVTPPTVTLGSLMTYTIWVPEPAITATVYSVVVTDTLRDWLAVEGLEVSGGVGGVWGWSDQVVTATFERIDRDTQVGITITARLSDTRPDAGSDADYGDVITNVAELLHDTGYTTSNQVDNRVVEPQLDILKVSDPPTSSTVESRDLVTFTVLITNWSGVDASPAYDVVFTDTLPVGMRETAPLLQDLSVDGALVPPGQYIGGWNAGTGAYTLTLAPTVTIAPGSVLRVIFRATVDTDVGAGLDLVNRAQVGWSSLPGPVAGDREYGPIEDTATVHTPPADGLTKRLTPPSVTIDSLVVFTVTVPDPGVGATLHDVVLTDTVDSRLEVQGVSAEGGATTGWDGQVVTVTWTSIPTFTRRLVTITSTVRGGITPGVITNVAEYRHQALTDSVPSNVVSTTIRLGRIGDYVWVDQDYNGVQNGGETPIEDVVIDLFDGTTGEYLTSTLTDASGWYLFDNLKLNVTYTVQISRVNFVSPTGALVPYTHTLYRGGTPFDNTDSNANPDHTFKGAGYAVTTTLTWGITEDLTLDFGFYQPLSLGDLVWRDWNNNGRFEPGLGETGIPTVTVLLYRQGDTPGSDAPVMTTTTSISGRYLFTGLGDGGYFVHIPSDQFGVGEPLHEMTSTVPTEPNPNTDQNEGVDENGIVTPDGVSSGIITLTADAEPLNDDVDDIDDTQDDDSNLTVDFGFYAPLSLGDLLWYDWDNDGVYEPGAGETGIPTVTVLLYRQGDTPGSAVPVMTTTTSITGRYLFAGLGDGGYFVHIPGDQFDAGQPLHEFTSTVPTALNPDSDEDNELDDENGIVTPYGVSSGIVTLTHGAEPMADDLANIDVTPDENSNLTVDFGFYRPLSLGDLVWYDWDNDGVYEPGAGETGIPTVTVLLYRQGDTPGSDVPVMTTTTTISGRYVFTGLIEGGYFVHIPSDQFGVGQPLHEFTSTVPTEVNPNTDDNEDLDENGIVTPYGVSSGIVTLTAGLEPVGEDVAGIDTATPDDNSNLSVDFGFYEPLSLGDLLWYDGNNNGVYEPGLGETGIPAVTVLLYEQGDTPGTDAPVMTTTTSITGRYLFTGLIEGGYVVHIPGDQFGVGQPLHEMTSTVPTEMNPNTDDNEDLDENGIVTPYGVSSGIVTLTAGLEPVGEDVAGIDTATPDDNSNLSVDFGFYEPLSLGDLVWYDWDNDGVYEPGVGETGIPTVTVLLYNQGDTPGSDAPVMTTTTSITGRYLFTGLIEGGYVVHIPGDQFGVGQPLEGLTSTVPTEMNPNTDDNEDLDENGIVTPYGVSSGIVTLTLGSEPLGDDVADIDATPDDNSNLSVDFGFYGPMSLGDLVWYDWDNDGVFETGDGEAGIEGVRVELYRNGDVPGFSTPLAFTDTDSNGRYLFPGLIEGGYVVHIPGDQFDVGQPLHEFTSTVPTELNPNTDDNEDVDENGIVDQYGVSSGIVTLTMGAEPTGEDVLNIDPGTPDDNSNLTVDFGFYPVPEIDVDKTVAPGAAARNMPFTYTVRIDNTGPITFNSLRLTDTLPADFHYVLGSGVPVDPDTVTEPLLVWDDLVPVVGVVPPGGSVTVTFAVTATPGVTGTYVNAVTGTAVTPGATVTDTDDAPIDIRDPEVVLVKEIVDIDRDGEWPDHVTFGIVITNVGPSVIDVLPLVDHYDPYYLGFENGTVDPDTEDPLNGILVWNDLTGPAPNGFDRDLPPGEAFVITTHFRIEHEIRVTTTNVATVTNPIDRHDNPADDDDDEEDIPGDDTDTQPPTAIELLYFRAAAGEAHVTLEWATAVELDVARFALYRATRAVFDQATLVARVPATGGGSQYAYEDRDVDLDQGTWYWLVVEDETGDGTGTYGPVQAGADVDGLPERLYLPLILNTAGGDQQGAVPQPAWMGWLLRRWLGSRVGLGRGSRHDRR